MRNMALIAAALLLAQTAQGDVISGLVFLDANGNGRYDEGERGVAEVPVSDGVSFVRTGPDGRYTIDAQVDSLLQPGAKAILTVSFPTGTWPTAGWFRRIDGEKDLKKVNFGLRKDIQKLPFLFIHATDAHVPRGGKNRFITFRKEMKLLADKVAFCIMTGDNVDNADVHSPKVAGGEYAFLAEETKDFPVPIFCVPGNHAPAGVNTKTGWDKDDPMYGYGLYWKHVGPMRWSFNYAGIHFAGIDYMDKADEKWTKGIPASAVAWLADDIRQLKPGTSIYLFVHDPRGSKAFDKLTKKHKLTNIFAGHSHTDETYSYAGIPCTISSSLGSADVDSDRSLGYRFVNVTQKGLKMFYKATGKPHAITIDSPRDFINYGNRRATPGIRPTDKIRGAFFDANGSIKRLTVKLGETQREVTFRRESLWCRFDAKLDVSADKNGKVALKVTVEDGKTNWSYSHNYRVLPVLKKTPVAEQGDQAVRELDHLSGHSYVVLAVILTISVIGMGWCFCAKAGTASRALLKSHFD